MKTLVSSILMGLSLSCMAITDHAILECSSKISKNKSEFGAFKKSELPDFSDQLRPDAPGVPYHYVVQRMFPLPKRENYDSDKDYHQAQLRSLAKNRVILFKDDQRSINKALQDKDLEKLSARTFPHPFSVKVKYRSKGTSLDTKGKQVSGPRVIVSGTTVGGGHGVEVFELEGSKKAEFEVKGQVVFNYTDIDKGGFLGIFGDYEIDDESKTHKSEILFKCTAHRPKVVVEAMEAMSEQEEYESDSYNYSLPSELNDLEVILE
ncbi:MAG: hypothetical protein CME62_07320 [Halobacteriovoraceae bacterium]|nr:hypothetical protein [Halobacteriovoraceae bacterium]